MNASTENKSITITDENNKEITVNLEQSTEPMFQTIYPTEGGPLSLTQLEESIKRYGPDVVVVSCNRDKFQDVNTLFYFNVFVRIYDPNTGNASIRRIELKTPEDEEVYEGVPDPKDKSFQGQEKDGLRRTIKIKVRSNFMKALAVLNEFIIQKLEPYANYFGYERINNSHFRDSMNITIDKGTDSKTNLPKCVTLQYVPVEEFIQNGKKYPQLKCPRTNLPILADMSNAYPVFSKGILHKLSIIKIPFATGFKGKISVSPKLVRIIWSYSDELEEEVRDLSQFDNDDLKELMGSMNELQIEDKKEE